METSFIPVLNSASVCLFSTILVAGLTVFKKIQSRWPVRVNCWFCNSYSKILRRDLTWWLCPSCEQYNGFTEDGDYKYSIPEQSKVRRSKNYLVSSKSKLSDYQNGLCKSCNNNEELKLLELRRFENSHPNYKDDELNKFKRNWDEKYPLCLDCNEVVKNSLYKQSMWLAEYWMIYMQKSLKDINNDKKSLESLWRILLVISNIAISSETFLWLSLISGITIQIVSSIFNASKRTGLLNFLLIILWIDVALLMVLPETPLLRFNFPIPWISSNIITTNHVAIFLRMVIAFESIKIKLKSKGFKGQISFRRIESCNNSFQDKLQVKKTSPKKSNPDVSLCPSPVNITDQPTTLLPLKKPVPLKVNQKIVPPQNQLEENTSPWSTNGDLNRSTKSLSCLSLDECSDFSTRSNRVFSQKVYGATSPDLFQRRVRKPILAPSKLRASVHSYNNFWRDDLDMPSVSRSSSQSSGFGSNGGELSRENSIVDLDRCSVMSELTVCCHQRHCESIANHVESKREPRRESASQCAFSTCDHPANVSNEKTTVVTTPPWLPLLLCGSIIFNLTVLCVVLFK